MTGTAIDPAVTRSGVVLAKVQPPRLHPGALPRPALVARILAPPPARCVVLRAGAGYGKTVLARQVVEADARAAAWVHLDPGDDDPVVLLRHVVAALGPFCPLGPVEAELAAGPPRWVDRLRPALAAALEAADPWVLVLDDVHACTSTTALDLVDQLVDLVPEGSTIVLSGRSAPDIGLPRRVLDGTAIEVTADDLAFSDAESRALLVRVLGGGSSALVDELVALTDGWPAGVHFGELALAGRPDPSAAAAELRSRTGTASQYFREELLRALPARTRAFLLRTSVLDALCPALCDAVLERQDAGVLLEELATSDNRFVVALGGGSGWYRYHHLFGELLLGELRRTAPSEESELRRRAALWLSDHHLGDEAVRQACSVGDVGFAAGIVYRELFAAFEQGHVASLERWLAAFTPSDARQHGLLALASAWSAFASGRADDVSDWIEQTLVLDVEGTLPDGTVSFDVARAGLVMVASYGGLKHGIEAAAVVRDAGPDGSPWWGLACFSDALFRYLAGGPDDAVAELELAEFVNRGSPTVHAVVLAHLALLHFHRGDDERGHELVRAATDEVREHGLEEYRMVIVVHSVAALAAARRGARHASRTAAQRALRWLPAARAGAARAAIHNGLVLAEAALLRGDVEEAYEQLADVETWMPAEPDAVVFWRWAEELRPRVDEMRSRAQGGPFDVTPAEMRVLAELPTHRSLEEIGEHLFVSRNTVKSHTLSIYRKLGVSRRGAAVARAIELGLLDPPRVGRDGD